MAAFGIPSYATLINTGKIKERPGEAAVEVETYFFKDCMAFGLSRVEVDRAWYVERYPDVGQAIGAGLVADAKDHWVRFGYYEHRWPREIRVDEGWYLRAYPDVKRAIDRRSFASAQEHFEQFGYREGRMPHADFSLVGASTSATS